jgi:hypothetical protein
MLDDAFDWLLLAYHLSLVILTIVGVCLFIRAMRQLPGRGYRKRLALQHYNSENAIAMVVEGATSMRSAGTTAAGNGATCSLRQHEDYLRMMLGRSRMAREGLRVVRAVLFIS